MYDLCFMSNLSSAEWASWFQAIGAIVAIFGSAAVARRQTSRQYRNDLDLQRIELESHRAEAAKTLLALAASSVDAMKAVASQLPDRESIHRAAEGLIPVSIAEVRRLDGYVAAIPLHDLPHSLVPKTLIVGSSIRQFQEKIEMALRVHTKMDAREFAELFRTIQEAAASMQTTCDEIREQVQRHAAEAQRRAFA